MPNSASEDFLTPTSESFAIPTSTPTTNSKNLLTLSTPTLGPQKLPTLSSDSWSIVDLARCSLKIISSVLYKILSKYGHYKCSGYRFLWTHSLKPLNMVSDTSNIIEIARYLLYNPYEVSSTRTCQSMSTPDVPDNGSHETIFQNHSKRSWNSPKIAEVA